MPLRTSRERVADHILSSYTVSLYILVLGLSTLLWAPYSGYYGRLPVYHGSLPFLSLGSLGATLCTNVTQLAISKAVQAFGAASVVSVGAGTISDIYKVEERGTAMGIFFGAILLGPALAPFAGGLASEYASWRLVQFALFCSGLIAWILVALFLPETSHPGERGIDKAMALGSSRNAGKGFVWLNPFKPLLLLKSPNVLFVVCISLPRRVQRVS